MFKTLYSKLIVVVGGIFLVTILAILVAVYVTANRQITQVGLAQAEALNQVAFEALYASMRQGGGREGNREVIKRLRENEAYSALHVVKGEPVVRQYGATPDEQPRDELDIQALAGTPALEIVQKDGRRVVRYASPVFVQPECQQCHDAEVGEINGVIATEISLEKLDAALQRRRNYLLRVVGGSLLLLLVAVFYAVQRLVIHPLQIIDQGTAAIAQGNLDHRLDIRTGDEMETLANGINEMVEQLDVTYSKIVEEQNTVLASIEASSDAIWISDADRRVAMVNPALERLIGKSREELLGQSCQYLMGMRSFDGTSLCDTSCPFLHPEDRHGAIEACMPVATGKEAWVTISYGRVTDANGELSQVVHIVHDLTERKEIEQLKDEFVSMVSHELRTPLHHIKGFSTTLLQNDVEWDVDTQRDFLESINQEADRLADLVDKLLHLSRLEAGRMPMDREWCAVDDLMDGALMKPCAQVVSDRIRLKIEPDLPPLFVDAREIESVLINLIENAIKYSAPGTPITLGAESRGDEVVFWVEDQGIGIPEDQLECIFDRFTRVNERNHRASSCGLGLAICKRVVEAHGGRIWVESREGVGSRFSFAIQARHRQPILLYEDGYDGNAYEKA